MVKKTFLNLEERKRKQIINAFLREFSVKTYDEASITLVVKQLGIAKGSIYQYFDDKFDLFMYLIGECSSVKKKYIESIDRDNYPDFWAYFRDLYEHGFRFDNENPLQSHFLYNFTQNLNSPSIKKFYDELLNQTVLAFETMAAHEVKLGLFRNDLPIQTVGFMLYKVGVSIQEQLEYSGAINLQKSIEDNLPVYQGKKSILMKMVDDYIQLVKPAFNKQ